MTNTPHTYPTGARVVLTDAGLATFDEHYPGSDLRPSTTHGTVTSSGRFGMDVRFDDGIVWEAAGVGGHDDEPIYFVPPCRCESSLCDHPHGPCGRPSDPALTMHYVGETCRPCAEAMRATGGAEYITEATHE